MEEEKDQNKVCKGCGKPFEVKTGVKEKDLYCTQCKIELAEENIKEKEIKLPVKKKKKKISLYFCITCLIIFVISIIYNVIQMKKINTPNLSEEEIVNIKINDNFLTTISNIEDYKENNNSYPKNLENIIENENLNYVLLSESSYTLTYYFDDTFIMYNSESTEDDNFYLEDSVFLEN